ncbi:tripartite tricarboxylate transporter substrate binding protein [Caenimonas sedimenti]|uniref:Tripartite tricarboxylate transporter substrate binding protein n=1 Tax=Caenimonas sedimenti TaxID=2596921 RepID=A0A562ZNK0_9BURK|nr:tripartite tricarboxylate transporter substrate binding protein [Caenimonas sedimenti]TWO70113.1 tripartite tricarboxylate transporter substrate binding protein [Caenimonas sedimenti]
MTQRRKLLQALAATPAVLLAGPWSSARAQGEYPAKPIRLIVPFPAGSTPDVFARVVSEKASQGLKQAIVIENRAGAGGNLGTDLVAKAAPDGYTIGASITGPLVNNVVLYKKMPYDPFKDLTPITFGVHQANVLAVSPALGVNTLKELMDLLRKNPGKYNYASIGLGSLSHLSIEMLKSLTNSYVVHIPYGSSPAAVTSVLAGDTQIVSLAPLAVMPQVAAGKLKAIAVSTAKRVPQIPNLPTFRESGVDFDGSAWIGLVAPGATPAPIIERLNREFVAAMRDPAINEKLRSQYMDAEPGTPQQFAAFMQGELKKWGPVIKRSGATIDS